MNILFPQGGEDQENWMGQHPHPNAGCLGPQPTRQVRWNGQEETAPVQIREQSLADDNWRFTATSAPLSPS
jgi:hypothetical protein